MTAGDQAWFNRGVIMLAGRAGEVRARRSSQAGWVRIISDAESIAYHEAAHAVAVVACGLRAAALTVIPETVSNGVVGGECSWDHSDSDTTEKPERGKPNPDRVLMADRTHAARCAWILAGNVPTWKRMRAIIREMQTAARDIIEQNWLAVAALANELQQRKTMDRAAIAPYVAPVRARK